VLNLVTAVRFDGRVQSGKTMPIHLACESDARDEIEVVAKLSASCEGGVRALVAESIAAMLAADLDLPVPEPFIVRLDPEFSAAIPDPQIADLALRSNPIAFGSRKLPPGYTTWPVGKAIPREALNIAGEIFAFDALIANADRRVENPNSLFLGTKLAIIDHELAFIKEGVIGWRPPWEVGALDALRRPQSHLFTEQLREKAIDLKRLAGAWAAISDARLAAYRGALPTEWNAAMDSADKALSHIAAVRDNLEPALQEIVRVLQ
jgi:HipA-like protein